MQAHACVYVCVYGLVSQPTELFALGHVCVVGVCSHFQSVVVFTGHGLPYHSVLPVLSNMGIAFSILHKESQPYV